MAKWADYLVSAVRYADTKTKKHISHVKVHADNGESVSVVADAWSREGVVNALDLNSTFYTIFKNPDGNWNKGANIEKIKINNEWFIKTDADNTEKDISEICRNFNQLRCF